MTKNISAEMEFFEDILVEVLILFIKFCQTIHIYLLGLQIYFLTESDFLSMCVEFQADKFAWYIVSDEAITLISRTKTCAR